VNAEALAGIIMNDKRMRKMNELKKAIEFRESGKLLESKTLLLDLLKLYPSNPDVWYQCAWVHDLLELEREAIPYYQKALELGLQDEDRKGALLGLGSTYRVLGMYEQSKVIFEKAIHEYPEDNEYRVFLAMAKYNLKEYDQAMEILLKLLSETSSDTGIQSYKKAIQYYSNKLDKVWK